MRSIKCVISKNLISIFLFQKIMKATKMMINISNAIFVVDSILFFSVLFLLASSFLAQIGEAMDATAAAGSVQRPHHHALQGESSSASHTDETDQSKGKHCTYYYIHISPLYSTCIKHLGKYLYSVIICTCRRHIGILGIFEFLMPAVCFTIQLHFFLFYQKISFYLFLESSRNSV
jgi:hypothetical protein